MNPPPLADPLPIEPLSAPIDATVVLPGSKSITNRALVCAALADGPSTLRGVLWADDTEAMLEALRALGLGLDRVGPDTVVVRPVQRWAVPPAPLDARMSGTTSRFLLPLLALDGATRTLDGDEQLRARPMGPSFDALRALGATIDDGPHPGRLPVRVAGPLRSGAVALAADESSQFLSGLLLSAPAIDGGLRVTITTDLVSGPYVDLTVAVMTAFGASVSADGSAWVVAGGGYRATDYRIEPDASAASYLMALAAVTAGRITIEGLHRDSLQGDVAFADVLADMGAKVTWHDDAVTVEGTGHLRGLDVDMEAISDTVPTLAVVAALAEGPTTIRGVGFIRAKESDRIAGPVTELQRVGLPAEQHGDGLTIAPVDRARLRPAVIETYRDHRMAMAFAVLGLAVPGIRIADPRCVDKTFPGYWDLLAALRAGTTPPARR